MLTVTASIGKQKFSCQIGTPELNRSVCVLPPQSLVLISKLPYVTFFHSLLKILAPEYFEKQEPCLEAGQCVSAAVTRLRSTS